jgi:hypothetical protein
MGALSRKPTTNLLLFHFLLFLLLLFAARVVRLVRTAVRIFARVRRRRRPAALLLRLLLVLHLAGSREKFPIRLAVGVFRLDRLEGCTRFPETDRIHSRHQSRPKRTAYRTQGAFRFWKPRVTQLWC